MAMRQGTRLGVLALMTGAAFSCGVLYAAEVSAGPLLVVAAMGGHYGHAAQGYLGVELRDVSDDEIAGLKLKEARGALIVNLDHDGPACKVGMKTQDVILEMNGQAIENDAQLRKMLRETPPGRRVTFVISRDGQTQTVSTMMADRRTVAMQAWEQRYTVPDPASETAGLPASVHVRGNGFMSSTSPAPSVGTATEMPKGHRDFLGTSMILNASFTGAQLEVMGPQLAQYFGAEDGAGLLVRSVDGNSPAELAGMRAGDVVIRVNSLPVASGTAWTKTIHDNKGRPVPVVVLRNRKEQTLTLTPDGKKRSSLIPNLGLEEFWEQTGQYTRELWAKL